MGGFFYFGQVTLFSWTPRLADYHTISETTAFLGSSGALATAIFRFPYAGLMQYGLENSDLTNYGGSQSVRDCGQRDEHLEARMKWCTWDPAVDGPYEDNDGFVDTFKMYGDGWRGRERSLNRTQSRVAIVYDYDPLSENPDHHCKYPLLSPQFRMEPSVNATKPNSTEKLFPKFGKYKQMGSFYTEEDKNLMVIRNGVPANMPIVEVTRDGKCRELTNEVCYIADYKKPNPAMADADDDSQWFDTERTLEYTVGDFSKELGVEVNNVVSKRVPQFQQEDDDGETSFITNECYCQWEYARCTTALTGMFAK